MTIGKPFNVWEWGHTDGYKHIYQGFAFSESDAAHFAAAEHREYGVVASASKHAVQIDNQYYLLAYKSPINIRTPGKELEIIKAKALSKLTTLEKELLGLKE